VDGVELVGLGGGEGEEAVGGEAGGDFFQPVPLDDGGFEEGGGGVGVVLEELGGVAGAGAGPHEVEAAVEGGGLGVPGLLDGGDGGGGDGEVGVAAVVDDVLCGGQAHGLELVRGGFEGIDLGGGELVGGGLVPVGVAIFEGVKGEALGFDGLLPVGTGGEGDADHLGAPASTVAAGALPAASVCAAGGEGAAEAAAGGRTGVAVASEWGEGAAGDGGADAAAAEAAVVEVVEGDEGEDAEAVVLALLLHLALLGRVLGLVSAELVFDDLVVFVDTALHLLLMAAGEEGEGGGGEEWGGDLGGAAHGGADKGIRRVKRVGYPSPRTLGAKS